MGLHRLHQRERRSAFRSRLMMTTKPSASSVVRATVDYVVDQVEMEGVDVQESPVRPIRTFPMPGRASPMIRAGGRAGVQPPRFTSCSRGFVARSVVAQGNRTFMS